MSRSGVFPIQTNFAENANEDASPVLRAQFVPAGGRLVARGRGGEGERQHRGRSRVGSGLGDGEERCPGYRVGQNGARAIG